MLAKWLLGDDQRIKENGVIWNAIGGAFNAGQSAIILIFISYKIGIEIAGITTIGYAIANLFLSMGKYGIRNYQVTDNQEKYSFNTYLYNRITVTFIVLFIGMVYMICSVATSSYTVEKALIVFFLILLKLIDAVEDVFLGRYQQCGRLDVGAKIMAIRLSASTAIICVLVVLGMGIYISLIAAILLSIVIDFYCIKKTFSITKSEIGCFIFDDIKCLLKECFPLCMGTTLSIFIGNMPKYMIDAYMDEEVQAIFGYIMMPVFVITLLNNFIYQPVVKKMGELWENREKKCFTHCVIRQCCIIVGMTVVFMIVGGTLGLPVLSILYNADLQMYQREFMVLLLGGGTYALAFYLNVPITTIRRQKYIAVGYMMAAILAVLLGKYFVIWQGMLGAALLYLTVNMLLVIIYTFVLTYGVKKS